MSAADNIDATARRALVLIGRADRLGCPLTFAALNIRMGLSPGIVSRAVARLIEAGLVRVDRSVKPHHLHVTDGAP